MRTARVHLRCNFAKALVFVALVASCESLSADENDPSALLQAACQKIAAADSLALEVEFAIRVGFPGLDHGKYARYQVALHRPNRFSFVRTSGDMGSTVVSDGQNLTNFVSELDQYTVRPAPKTLEEFSSSIGGMTLIEGGMGGFIMALVSDDPYTRFTGENVATEYVGKEEINGQLCHRLRFEEEDLSFDAWVASGEDPVLRRICPDLTSQFDEKETASGFQILVSFDYKNWSFEPADDMPFAFTPPTTAKLVNEITPREPEPVMPPVKLPHALLGQPAPKFALVSLSGDEAFELADVLGKRVIVLDFWATWCPPCVESLPKLAELSDKFAGKPVAIYAVNLEEDAKTISEFLKAREIEISVLLDAQASVAEKYDVKGIPQMVLIGLDGRVQVVHDGPPDDLHATLSTQIEALLDGEDLAAQALDDEAQSENAKEAN